MFLNYATHSYTVLLLYYVFLNVHAFHFLTDFANDFAVKLEISNLTLVVICQLLFSTAQPSNDYEYIYIYIYIYI